MERLLRLTGGGVDYPLACIAGVVLVLLASGCTPLGRRPSAPQPLAVDRERRTLSDAGLKRFMEEHSGEPLDKWPLGIWNFPKLTLAAYYFNPALEVARSQSQTARRELAGTRGELDSRKSQDPVFGTEAMRGSSTGMGGTTDAAHLFREPPSIVQHTNIASLAPDSGRHARRIAEAERAARSAQWQLERVTWQVRSRVRTNLIAYAALQHGTTLLEELETTSEKLVKAAESRVAAGSMSYLELSQLQLKLAQTRLVLIRTRLEKMDARERLAESLSLPVNALFDVEVDFDFSQRPPLGLSTRDLRWQALHRRPDVLALRADYYDAENVLRNATAKTHPHPPFPPGFLWDERGNRWKIDPELGLPPGQRNSRNAERLNSLRLSVAARLLDLQAEISDEVERSSAVYRVTAEEVAEIHDLNVALVRQHSLLADRFEPGETESPERLLARLQLLSAGVAELEAQVKLQNALGSVEHALQLPIELIRRPGLF